MRCFSEKREKGQRRLCPFSRIAQPVIGNDDSLRVAGFRQPSLSDSVSAIVTLSPNPDIDVTLDDSVSVGNIPQTPSFGLSPIPIAQLRQK